MSSSQALHPAQELSRRLESVEAARADHLRLLEDVERRLGDLGAAVREALLALATAYLARLDGDALARAERLTGFRGFTQRDPRKAMDQEAAVLGKTIRRIEVDERWRRREYLVGPIGERTRALEEARSLLEPWEADARTFESQPEFLALVEQGYDTPAYAVTWTELRYWKNWAAGDAICRALGLDDFGDDVLPAWKRVAGERDKWRSEVARAEASVAEIHDLVRERDEAEARLPRLGEIYLGQCREALAGHLAHADAGLLESWLDQDGDADRAILQALRRAAGLRAKEEMVREMRDGVAAFVADLGVRAQKIGRKRDKGMRRPDAVGPLSPPEAFDEKVARWDASRRQAEEALVRLDAYDRYDRFHLSSAPELWWYEFTHGRPTRYQERLRGWYERNRDARPTHDRRDRERADLETVAAAAAAQESAVDRGYVS